MSDWQIGDRIQGRWQVEKIFKGGMGIVYVVWDQESGEIYAAKTFQKELLEGNSQAVARFTQEALAWIQLDLHPNIAQANSILNIEGRPILFLEYVTGGDLSRWIGTLRLTADFTKILHFAVEFCDGMTHALAKGIQAHRDIKPANCLITADEVLKITDFGLAKVFDESATDSPPVSLRMTHSGASTHHAGLNLSITGASAGTCTHMAPEQFDDVKHVDVRADVYSFGIMLFQMIEGRLPFQGRSWSEFERLHKTESPPLLTNVDPDIRDLVETCLAKDPAERLSNFEEIRRVLEGVYAKRTGASAPKAIAGAELNAFQLNNKASSLANLGRLNQALSCYDQALSFDPDLATSFIGKGAVMESLGRIEDALACYARALEINPADAVAWSNKGNALAANHCYDQAISCFERAIQSRPLYATAWLNKGAVLSRLGQDSDALSCMERALEIDPRDADAWSNKASCLGALGRHKEAFLCFQRAVEINPQLEKAWFNRGLLFGAIGNMEDSLHCFEKTLEINPTNREGWFYKGRTLGSLGRLAEAIHCFDRARELDHPEASEYIALCQKPLTEQDYLKKHKDVDDVEQAIKRGLALKEQGRMDEAIVCYDLAIQIDSRNADAWAYKCFALSALRRAEEALACAEKVQQLGHPKGPQLAEACRELVRTEQTYQKGLELHQLGRLDEEIACYEQVLHVEPQHVKAWHNKGVALLMLMRLEEALPCLEQAHKLGHPQSLQAIEITRKYLAEKAKRGD